MVAYIIRRVIVGLLMLVAMSFIVFALFMKNPVDPAQFSCGKNCPPERIEETRKALGYDQPLLVQWGSFAKGVVVGRDYPANEAMREANPELVTECAAPCLGYSQQLQMTVNAEIAEAAPISISIAMVAVTIWVIFGVLFGVLAAIVKGSLLDRGVVGGTLALYAFPTFFVGALLINFVAIKWGIFPAPGYVSIAEGGVGQWLVQLLLPGFTLAVVYMAGYVRMTRAFVLESMSEDYIRTAKAKGVKSPKVLFKHALRAALTPLVTMFGLDFAAVLGGAIITEDVFNYYGLGKLAVTANETFDLPTIVGLVLLLGSLVILANIIVDILYAFIDPRVRVA
ncbi:ABC transporter permease [Nocardioides panzhihuensis]|uniref:Peptide/nickel transport system permease protein n=1 Tax=Nocardioides panzhihuensis TaxID=860243 RepID=A0A7Z0ISG8_9ACTN|nr:ABC transporter permease [Nocardioides panzhihuensis]NYI77767.1 peptide/nickel transport system permease protein [Nocardioides panzhihuensis]